MTELPELPLVPKIARIAGCGALCFMSIWQLATGKLAKQSAIAGDGASIAGDEPSISGDESLIAGDEWG